MGTLICTGIVSADGYVNDEAGRFDWAEPDPEVHAFVNELESDVTTYVWGRRLYEVMRFWQDPPGLADAPDYVRDYADLWEKAEKVVVSSTLAEVETRRTRLMRGLDPALLEELVAGSGAHVSIGGPTLAAAAFGFGLVDEVRLITVPFVTGGGTRFLPDGFRAPLRLLDERRFGGGTVYTRYAVERSAVRLAPALVPRGSR